jgi:hypothetical protein
MQEYTQVQPKKCKGLKIFEYHENILDDIQIIKKHIDNHEAVIIKNFIDKTLLLDIKKYLFNIGINSLPSYHSLDKKIPDHHLILKHHPDSYIDNFTHKFYFYPWNQNIFDFFNIFSKVFELKNLISDLPKDKYFSSTPIESDFVLRCVFHHYPLGGGYITKHADTIGVHQKVTSILALTTKGEDFHNGGLYVIDINNEKVYVDKYLQTGNVLFFNPEIEHGVDEIDDNSKEDGFFDINGRWIMIAATIKSAKNTKAKTAIELK